MLTEAQITEFHHNGFLNGGRILDDDQIQELKDELEKQAALRAKIRSLQPWVVTNTAGRVLRNES